MTGTPPAISTAAGFATKHGSTTSTSSPGSRIAFIAKNNASLTPTVTTLDFSAFDADIADLRAAGVRIFGPGASVSQDLEPEYIAVSGDDRFAWVSLQENNALALIDLGASPAA